MDRLVLSLSWCLITVAPAQVSYWTNPIDTPLLPDGQTSTLTELMFDYSGSGSGKLLN